MIKQFKISIDAPIEKIFSAFEDENKIQNWMGGELFTEFKTARDPKSPVGVKFKQNVKNILELEGEVIAYHSPILLGIGWKTKGLTGTIHYHFSETDDGSQTQITCDLEVFDGTKKSRLATRLLSPLFDVLMESQLKGIKKLSEEN